LRFAYRAQIAAQKLFRSTVTPFDQQFRASSRRFFDLNAK